MSLTLEIQDPKLDKKEESTSNYVEPEVQESDEVKNFKLKKYGEIIKEGYLYKRSSILGKWQKRYAAIRKGKLYLYKSSKEKFDKGKASLDINLRLQNSFVEQIDSVGKKDMNAIELTSYGRTVTIRSDTRQQDTIWAEAIRDVIAKEFV